MVPLSFKNNVFIRENFLALVAFLFISDGNTFFEHKEDISLAILETALSFENVVCFLSKFKYFGLSRGISLLLLIQFFRLLISFIFVDIKAETLSWSDEKLGRNAIFFLEIAASIAVVQPLCKSPSLASSHGLTSPSYTTFIFLKLSTFCSQALWSSDGWGLIITLGIWGSWFISSKKLTNSVNLLKFFS